MSPAINARGRRELVESKLTPLVRDGGEPKYFSIEGRMSHYRVPGVSVAVVKDGKIDWAKGYGYRSMATLEKVTSETLFQAGSISKPVAAIGLMRLAEEGKIDLYKDIDQQLQGWKAEGPKRGEQVITPRMILGHRAGLSMGGVPGWFFDERASTLLQTLRAEAFDQSSQWRPDKWRGDYPPVTVTYDPSSEWHYSGGGYCALGLLVEQASGKSFNDSMQELVFNPMGLTRSSFETWTAEERPADVADGHMEYGEVVPGACMRLTCGPAAGLWTTARELASIFVDVQRVAQKQDGLLRPESVAAMLEPAQPAPPLFEGYGLGFVLEGLDGEVRFGHHGSNGLYKGLAIMFRDRPDGAVILTNGWQGFEFAEELLNSIARAYDWPGYTLSQQGAMSDKSLQAYEGEYLLELETEKRPVTVAFKEDALKLSVQGDDSLTLFPAFEGEAGQFFVLREGHPRSVRFEKKGKKVSGFTFEIGPRLLRAQRIGSLKKK